ncbi:hypothetical protein [Mesorhizobium sp. KR1-2]|uniref:hypothetical protein n=1 Tax=Mesorhizobium sp. KR1-2 TaxID=3156609 RepID=UPI0032B547F7
MAEIKRDETGDRLGPVHATRHGKRYRHYVSRRLLSGVGKDDATGWRLAASEIEPVVNAELCALPADEAAISGWVCALRSPAQMMPALAAARQFRADAPDQQRQRCGMISRVFARITLSPGCIRFEARPGHLLDKLLGGVVPSVGDGKPGGAENAPRRLLGTGRLC